MTKGYRYSPRERAAILDMVRHPLVALGVLEYRRELADALVFRGTVHPVAHLLDLMEDHERMRVSRAAAETAIEEFLAAHPGIQTLDLALTASALGTACMQFHFKDAGTEARNN